MHIWTPFSPNNTECLCFSGTAWPSNHRFSLKFKTVQLLCIFFNSQNVGRVVAILPHIFSNNSAFFLVHKKYNFICNLTRHAHSPFVHKYTTSRWSVVSETLYVILYFYVYLVFKPMCRVLFPLKYIIGWQYIAPFLLKIQLFKVSGCYGVESLLPNII